ncbi:MAG: DUF421 domain-containing protein [Firmicutes bacterium]|nr:DUF421 domain-containing protein [Bacillota bacterium]
MNHILTLAMRALVMFATVFLAIRLLGKRIMANLTPMDRVSNITYGTIAGSVAVNPSTPLFDGIVAIAGFAVIAWLVGLVSVHIPAVRPLLLGKARPLIVDGKVDAHALQKAQLSSEELEMRLRELKVSNPKQVQFAQLEPDGKLGLIPKKNG